MFFILLESVATVMLIFPGFWAINPIFREAHRSILYFQHVKQLSELQKLTPLLHLNFCLR